MVKMFGTFDAARTFSGEMNAYHYNDRARRRAEKLQREAANCLSLAVREQSGEFAAALIEEAAMLAKRATELSQP